MYADTEGGTNISMKNLIRMYFSITLMKFEGSMYCCMSVKVSSSWEKSIARVWFDRMELHECIEKVGFERESSTVLFRNVEKFSTRNAFLMAQIYN
jgi:hypothetical protein